MNRIIKILPAIFLASCTLHTFAQKIKIENGNLSLLKGQKNINVEFTYNNLKVGKYDKEADYVTNKKNEMNKKEAGTGDKWAKAWANDRETRYKPKFEELFNKYSPVQTAEKEGSKYTMIYNTFFIEPGFNIGITRKNARHDAEILIVETADKKKVIAKISVEKALGRDFWGTDFDTGYRIAETYADAGKAVGKFLEEQLK